MSLVKYVDRKHTDCEKWDTFTGNLRVTDGNSFGYIAAEAAYTDGHAWYEEMTQFMQETCGLAFDYGDWFGGKNFAGFIRMNLATSRENVEMAVQRIVGNLK